MIEKDHKNSKRDVLQKSSLSAKKKRIYKFNKFMQKVIRSLHVCYI